MLRMPVFLRWLLDLGPTNPITVRLIGNGSRRPKHMYIRTAYLGALILVLLWSLLTIGTGGLSYRALAQAGAASFTYTAYLQIGLICILAPVFMAGAIAQEASPRTWEVLLTTPLTALQIVLGNLLGRLFFILALLFASLPLFALTQYFGGVPGSAILTSYLVAACLALLVGAVAIALAVSRLAGKRAVFAFYVAVVTYLAVTAGVDAYLRQIGAGQGPVGQGVTWMTALNPFLSLHALLNPTTYPTAIAGTHSGAASWLLEHPVRTWCVGSAGVSLLLVLLSTFTVRTGGLGALTSDQSGVPWYRRLLGFGAAGAEHRAPRAVWQNPIAWREAAARNATLGRALGRWAFILAGAAFGVLLVILYHTASMNHDEFRLALAATVGGELVVVTLVAMNQSATSVSREREDGTLDLLLTTPITASAYLWGKLRGLVASMLPMLAVPMGTLAIAGLYVLFDGLGRKGGVLVPSGGAGVPPMPVLLPEAALVVPAVVLPFTAFCCMIGMQWSLKSRGTLGSVVATVGLVGVVSGIVGLCAWKAGPEIAVVGPGVSALSPATLLYSVISPGQAMAGTLFGGGGLSAARSGLFVGSLISGAIYLAVVYGVHANMVRTFDTTVRKLAGGR